MQKLCSVYVLFDDLEYLDLSLSTVTKVSDHTIILLNKKTWHGDFKRDDFKVKGELEKLKIKYYPKLEIIETDCKSEHEQRNLGIGLSYQRGCQWTQIIDSDEFFSLENQQMLYRAIQEAPSDFVAIRCPFITYFKYLYKVVPPESWMPIILVKNGNFVFTDKREGTSNITNGKVAAIQLDYHHFSYARSDEYVAKKLKSTEHAGQVIPGWYENVWLKFTPDMTNLNPCWAEAYQKVEKVELNTLPQPLQEFFKDKING